MTSIEESYHTVLKADRILNGKEKGLPEEAKRLYSIAGSFLEELLDKDPENHYASYLLSYIYYQRALQEKNNDEARKLTKLALKGMEHCANLDDYDEDTYYLWGTMLFYLASNTPLLKENEQYLVRATEILLKATDRLDQPRKRTYDLLKKCFDALSNGAKDRERTGLSVYRLAGTFVKQGGSVKTWKSRWFVCSDTNLYYYKDKKDWENGPVKGNPAPPQGSIEFSEIVRVSAHMDFICELIESRPKKSEKTYCLHLHTKDRIYNMLGFESKELTEKWLSTITFAVRTHHLKKEAKKFLNTRTDLKDPVSEDVFVLRPPPAKKVRFVVSVEEEGKEPKKLPKDSFSKEISIQYSSENKEENKEIADGKSEENMEKKKKKKTKKKKTKTTTTTTTTTKDSVNNNIVDNNSESVGGQGNNSDQTPENDKKSKTEVKSKVNNDADDDDDNNNNNKSDSTSSSSNSSESTSSSSSSSSSDSEEEE